MRMKESYLDCCSEPDLDVVMVILETNREDEPVRQCKPYRTYWFHRFLEIMMSDDQTV
jgi:hypothetical protein